MTGRIEFYKVKGGEYRFRLTTGSDDIVLCSEAYKSKLGCTKGIESVRVHSSNPDNFVKEPTANGGHQFKLVSSNGRVLGVSEIHGTAASYNSALANVARLARGATLVDKT